MRTSLRVLTAVLPLAAWLLLYFGVELLLPMRQDPVDPLLPLVSGHEGTAQDIYSSVPGLLALFLAAVQSMLLVTLAELALAIKKRLSWQIFMTANIFKAALLFDWFHRWGNDWLAWSLFRLRLGDLCSAAEPCYPSSGAFPALSLLVLVGLLALIIGQTRLAEADREEALR